MAVFRRFCHIICGALFALCVVFVPMQTFSEGNASIQSPYVEKNGVNYPVIGSDNNWNNSNVSRGIVSYNSADGSYTITEKDTAWCVANVGTNYTWDSTNEECICQGYEANDTCYDSKDAYCQDVYNSNYIWDQDENAGDGGCVCGGYEVDDICWADEQEYCESADNDYGYWDTSEGEGICCAGDEHVENGECVPDGDPEQDCIDRGNTWSSSCNVCIEDEDDLCTSEGYDGYDETMCDCSAPESDPEQECIDNGGIWDDEGLDCITAAPDPEQDCIDDGGHWDGAECQYCTWDDTCGECVPNCESSYGPDYYWDSGECSCTTGLEPSNCDDGYEGPDGQCYTDEQDYCESTSGTWCGGSCYDSAATTCAEGTWDEEQCECVNPEQDCIDNGGTWDSELGECECTFGWNDTCSMCEEDCWPGTWDEEQCECVNPEQDCIDDGGYWNTSESRCYPFSLTTTALTSNNNSFQFYISAMSAPGAFYVDCGDNGTLTSTANDVTNNNTITRSDTTGATYTCTWNTPGVHTIRFGGRATGYSSNGNDRIYAAIRFIIDCNDPGTCADTNARKVASIAGSLGAIFRTLGSSNDLQPLFRHTFAGCSNLRTIPGNLFDGVTGSRWTQFSWAFAYSGITAIPSTLFSGATGGADAMFGKTFQGCLGLTSLPDNLFAGITSAINYEFGNTFNGCSNLTGYIPSTFITGLVNAGHPSGQNLWIDAFYGTKLLTSCPAGTYQYFTGYEGSGSTKWNGKVSCIPCTSGTTSPAGATSSSQCVTAYTVTLYQNEDASNDTANGTVLVANGLAMPGTNASGVAYDAPTRTGYTFNGYYSARSGGTKYYNSDMTSASNWGTSSNGVLYAQWTEITSSNCQTIMGNDYYWNASANNGAGACVAKDTAWCVANSGENYVWDGEGNCQCGGYQGEFDCYADADDYCEHEYGDYSVWDENEGCSHDAYCRAEYGDTYAWGWDNDNEEENCNHNTYCENEYDVTYYWNTSADAGSGGCVEKDDTYCENEYDSDHYWDGTSCMLYSDQEICENDGGYWDTSEGEGICCAGDEHVENGECVPDSDPEQDCINNGGTWCGGSCYDFATTTCAGNETWDYELCECVSSCDGYEVDGQCYSSGEDYCSSQYGSGYYWDGTVCVCSGYEADGTCWTDEQEYCESDGGYWDGYTCYANGEEYCQWFSSDTHWDGTQCVGCDWFYETWDYGNLECVPSCPHDGYTPANNGEYCVETSSGCHEYSSNITYFGLGFHIVDGGSGMNDVDYIELPGSGFDFNGNGSIDTNECYVARVNMSDASIININNPTDQDIQDADVDIEFCKYNPSTGNYDLECTQRVTVCSVNEVTNNIETTTDALYAVGSWLNLTQADLADFDDMFEYTTANAPIYDRCSITPTQNDGMCPAGQHATAISVVSATPVVPLDYATDESKDDSFISIDGTSSTPFSHYNLPLTDNGTWANVFDDGVVYGHASCQPSLTTDNQGTMYILQNIDNLMDGDITMANFKSGLAAIVGETKANFAESVINDLSSGDITETEAYVKIASVFNTVQGAQYSTTDNGQYCYCQVNGWQPTGESKQAVSGAPWVFTNPYSDANNCAQYCAYACNYSVYDQGPEYDSVRAAMFGAYTANATCVADEPTPTGGMCPTGQHATAISVVSATPVVPLDYTTGGSSYGYISKDGTSTSNEDTYGLTDNGTWAVEFDDGVVYGRASCQPTDSTGTVYTMTYSDALSRGSMTTEEFMSGLSAVTGTERAEMLMSLYTQAMNGSLSSDGMFSVLSTATNANYSTNDTGTYCFCQIDGWKPNGQSKQTISNAPWVSMLYERDTASECASSCVSMCTHFMRDQSEDIDGDWPFMRAAMMRAYTASATCESDTPSQEPTCPTLTPNTTVNGIPVYAANNSTILIPALVTTYNGECVMPAMLDMDDVIFIGYVQNYIEYAANQSDGTAPINPVKVSPMLQICDDEISTISAMSPTTLLTWYQNKIQTEGNTSELANAAQNGYMDSDGFFTFIDSNGFNGSVAMAWLNSESYRCPVTCSAGEYLYKGYNMDNPHSTYTCETCDGNESCCLENEHTYTAAEYTQMDVHEHLCPTNDTTYCQNIFGSNYYWDDNAGECVTSQITCPAHSTTLADGPFVELPGAAYVFEKGPECIAARIYGRFGTYLLTAPSVPQQYQTLYQLAQQQDTFDPSDDLNEATFMGIAFCKYNPETGNYDGECTDAIDVCSGDVSTMMSNVSANTTSADIVGPLIQYFETQSEMSIALSDYDQLFINESNDIGYQSFCPDIIAECPDGTFYDGIADCISCSLATQAQCSDCVGDIYYWNNTATSCQFCDVNHGYEYESEDNACHVACDTGYSWNSSRMDCVDANGCTAAEEYDGNVCHLPCQGNYVWDSNNRECGCPTGRIDDGSNSYNCILDCSSYGEGYYGSNGECVRLCPEHSTVLPLGPAVEVPGQAFDFNRDGNLTQDECIAARGYSNGSFGISESEGREYPTGDVLWQMYHDQNILDSDDPLTMMTMWGWVFCRYNATTGNYDGNCTPLVNLCDDNEIIDFLETTEPTTLSGLDYFVELIEDQTNQTIPLSSYNQLFMYPANNIQVQNRCDNTWIPNVNPNSICPAYSSTFTMQRNAPAIEVKAFGDSYDFNHDGEITIDECITTHIYGSSWLYFLIAYKSVGMTASMLPFKLLSEMIGYAEYTDLSLIGYYARLVKKYASGIDLMFTQRTYPGLVIAQYDNLSSVPQQVAYQLMQDVNMQHVAGYSICRYNTTTGNYDTKCTPIIQACNKSDLEALDATTNSTQTVENILQQNSNAFKFDLDEVSLYNQCSCGGTQPDDFCYHQTCPAGFTGFTGQAGSYLSEYIPVWGCAPIEYDINFYSNGGDGYMSDIKCNYGTSCRLPANEFTKYNSMFIGWNTESDGSGDGFVNGQSVMNLTTENYGNINLYAQWVSGTSSCSDGEYLDNGECATCPAFAPESHNAASIYDCHKSFTGGYYYDGATQTQQVCSENHYCPVVDIYYSELNEANNAETTVNLYECPMYSSSQISQPYCTCDRGYANSSHGQQATQEDGCTFTEFDIIYILNGGTNNDSNVSSYTVSDSVTFYTPSKLHATFVEWQDENENRITGIPTNSIGDRTITAIWDDETMCNSGYYMDDDTCVMCEAGYYCPGNNNRYECNPNSTSTAGSDHCSCQSGFTDFTGSLSEYAGYSGSYWDDSYHEYEGSDYGTLGETLWYAHNPNGYIIGESSCNNVGYQSSLVDDESIGTGSYCWCRITNANLYTPERVSWSENGDEIISPALNSDWVYFRKYDNYDSCSSGSCTRQCGRYINNGGNCTDCYNSIQSNAYDTVRNPYCYRTSCPGNLTLQNGDCVCERGMILSESIPDTCVCGAPGFEEQEIEGNTVCEVIYYDISYSGTDGATYTGGSLPGVYSVEYSNITIYPMSKSGYTFLGWCDQTNPNCTPSDTTYTIAHGSTGNKTLYAKWTCDGYEVNGVCYANEATYCSTVYGNNYYWDATANNNTGACVAKNDAWCAANVNANYYWNGNACVTKDNAWCATNVGSNYYWGYDETTSTYTCLPKDDTYCANINYTDDWRGYYWDATANDGAGDCVYYQCSMDSQHWDSENHRCVVYCPAGNYELSVDGTYCYETGTGCPAHSSNTEYWENLVAVHVPAGGSDIEDIDYVEMPGIGFDFDGNGTIDTNECYLAKMNFEDFGVIYEEAPNITDQGALAANADVEFCKYNPETGNYDLECTQRVTACTAMDFGYLLYDTTTENFTNVVGGWLNLTASDLENFDDMFEYTVSEEPVYDRCGLSCDANYYMDNGECVLCSQGTNGAYTLSDAGRGGIEKCYAECSIPNASATIGRNYYGGINTCEAIACSTGYSLTEPALSTRTPIVPLNYMTDGTTYGYIDANNDNSSDTDTFGLTNANTWAVDFDGDHAIYGVASCQKNIKPDQQGFIYLSDNLDAITSGEWATVKPGLVSIVGQSKANWTEGLLTQMATGTMDEATAYVQLYNMFGVDDNANYATTDTGRYCFCKVDGYSQNGGSIQSVADTQWAILPLRYGSANSCASGCASDCAYVARSYSMSPVIRATLFGLFDKVLPSCQANTFNVSYAAGDGATGNAPSTPTSCTYGESCVAPENTYTKEGYTFSGWACSCAIDGGTCSCANETYAAGASIANATTTNGATITLTAQWVMDCTANMGAHYVWDGTANNGAGGCICPSPYLEHANMCFPQVITLSNTNANDKVYLDYTAQTTPAFNVVVNGNTYHANMTMTPTYMTSGSEHYLKVIYDNETYYVCDNTTYVAPTE